MCRSLHLLFFSYGFHSRAVLATCLSGLLSVWPIQPHTHFFFISSSTSHSPACLHNSSFEIVQSHQIYRILLRHLLKNTCNFWFSSLVSLHISTAYKSTIFKFDSKTLNLVPVVSLTLQTPSLPSQFIAWWPTQFPFLLTMLIRFQHLSSSFIFPAIITPSLSLPFVFVYLSAGQPLPAVPHKPVFCPSYPVSCVTKRPDGWDHWTPCFLIMVILVTQSRVTWNT